MLIRDAGWAALAATLYGLCWWQVVWGSWPSPHTPEASVVASAHDQRPLPDHVQSIISSVKGTESRRLNTLP